MTKSMQSEARKAVKAVARKARASRSAPSRRDDGTHIIYVNGATAKRMIESGMLAVKDIAKFSGLSLAQVKKLQAEMA